jgi:hypothetical protein
MSTLLKKGSKLLVFGSKRKLKQRALSLPLPF